MLIFFFFGESSCFKYSTLQLFALDLFFLKLSLHAKPLRKTRHIPSVILIRVFLNYNHITARITWQQNSGNKIIFDQMFFILNIYHVHVNLVNFPVLHSFKTKCLDVYIYSSRNVINSFRGTFMLLLFI